MDNISFPSAPLKNSRFLHLFQQDQIFCLQHSLTFEKVYGGRILQVLFEYFHNYRNLTDSFTLLSSKFPKNIIEDSISFLYKKGLLIENDNYDHLLHLTLANEGCNFTPIGFLYLIPTIDCNFKCEYCFVINEGRVSNKKLMDINTAKNGLNLFAKLTEDVDYDPGITYYGGEPLLNAEVVYASMKYIRELEEKGIFKNPVIISIVTNGSMINKKALEVFDQVKPLVSISIDGPAHLHDAVRKDLTGNGTFAKALAGYRLLQERGQEPGLSCTISQFNLQHIEEVTEFILTELKPRNLGFNILLPQVKAKDAHDYDHELAARQVIRAFKVFREHGIYEDRMMRRVNPYVDKKVHLKDCQGVGGQLVLTPEGHIGPCQAFLGMNNFFPLRLDELREKISTITSEDIYKNPLFDEWRHRFPLNMKECLDCFAIGICGGGCPYAALVDYGSIWEIDKRICYQAKQMMEWLIWDTYDHLMESTNQSES